MSTYAFGYITYVFAAVYSQYCILYSSLLNYVSIIRQVIQSISTYLVAVVFAFTNKTGLDECCCVDYSKKLKLIQTYSFFSHIQSINNKKPFAT